MKQLIQQTFDHGDFRVFVPEEIDGQAMNSEDAAIIVKAVIKSIFGDNTQVFFQDETKESNAFYTPNEKAKPEEVKNQPEISPDGKVKEPPRPQPRRSSCAAPRGTDPNGFL